ncbi:MAG: diguanylate cyclase [Clostridia bacterium]|nr:diguanylate cyclase [Clostridia bacterium]
MVEILKRYYKLIVVMVFLVAAIFYGQFVYSSGVVKSLGEEKVEENFNSLVYQINHWLEHKERAIEESSLFISYLNNEKEVLNYLKGKLNENPEFNSIYFLTPENKMINASGYIPSPDIDFRTRPWYFKAMNTQGTIFTDVFMNATETELIVSIATPVINSEGKILGVIAGDISLNSISKILEENSIIPESEKFIIDDQGNLIVGTRNAVPDNKEVLTGNLNYTGWKIVMTIPQNFLEVPINTLRGNLVVTLLIFFATMFIFAYLQRRVIAEPLVSYEKDVKRKFKTERKNFEALFKNSSDAIAIVDDENRIIEVNEKFEKLFEYKQEEIKGKDIDSLIVSADKIEEAKNFTELLFKDKVDSVETVRYDKYGNPKDIELKGIPILLDGKLIGGYASYTDISARKAFEKDILFMSYHDQLTGIYNRRYFEEKLKELDTKENYPLSLVMADLNGLKLANDAFGHSFGDKLLIKTAEILNNSLEGEEFVSRMGGDEFIIVLPKTSPEELREYINKLSEEIYNTRIGTIDLSVSFGWETKINDDQDIIDLMNKAESYMYKRKLSESPSMISSTIKIIISTLHEKNKREKLHSERVGEICEAIGREMGFDQEELSELKLIGLMHDIGKIGIDEKILNKDGKLTPEEYEEIKKHPEIGYRILSSANQMSDIAEYTLAHHERWDGKGYPNGISGKEIPLVSRIIAVADAYDAMTSERTYRKPLSEKEAVEELRKYAGTQFDPIIVKIFTEKVLKY